MKARLLLKRLAKEGAFDLHYRARFIPQRWEAHNEAVEVEPQGEIYWDVTEEIIDLPPRLRQDALRGHSMASDNLARSKNAPEWVRRWFGPYEVAVEVQRGHSGEWVPGWTWMADNEWTPDWTAPSA